MQRGRPRTIAAEYERIALRLPPELSQTIRAEAARFGRPLNVQLVMLLRMGCEVLSMRRQYAPRDDGTGHSA